jgi:hypothetical protein
MASFFGTRAHTFVLDCQGAVYIANLRLVAGEEVSGTLEIEGKDANAGAKEKRSVELEQLGAAVGWEDTTRSRLWAASGLRPLPSQTRKTWMDGRKWARCAFGSRLMDF